MLLRRALHARGLRYALHKRLAKGCTPDVVLVRHRIALFVDGDLWHGCPQHGRMHFSGPNAPLWEEKIRRNRERDVRADALATAQGYRVLRFWECEVRRSAAACADLVSAQVLEAASSAPASTGPGSWGT